MTRVTGAGRDTGKRSTAALPTVDLSEPITAEDRVFVPTGSLDPHMDTCPPWCELAAHGHPYTLFEEDRSHCGPATYVPVRSLQARSWDAGSDSGYTLGHVSAYLQRRALHARPVVHVEVAGIGDDAERVSFDLTADEARAVIRDLSAHVERIDG